MNIQFYTFCLLSILLFNSCSNTSNSSVENAFFDFTPTPDYIQTSKGSISDSFFGIKITDPYRWLEDAQTVETLDWITHQNTTTSDFLNKISFRAVIEKRLHTIWDYEHFSVPIIQNGQLYYFKNDGLQNQAVLYQYQKEKAISTPIFDSAELYDDDTQNITIHSLSKNGQYFAYGITNAQSAWTTIQILDLKSNHILSDELKWVKFSTIAWHKNGFFYSRYDESSVTPEQQNEFHKVYYHTIGTTQADDKLIFADRQFAHRHYTTQVTQDEQFLILNETASANGNMLYFKNLNHKNTLTFIPLTTGFNNDFKVVGNIGTKLLVVTNYKAPMSRLISIDTHHPKEENWVTLITESEHVLDDVILVNQRIVAKYTRNASSQLKIFAVDGEIVQEIELPELGTVEAMSVDQESNTFYFSFQSFTQPISIYKYDFTIPEPVLFQSPTLSFDPDDFQTVQVKYKSSNGVTVPMFIIWKDGNDIKLDGQNPTLLYGYGGFNQSITPHFEEEHLSFLEQGGILAVPNIRGGGEFGKRWHKEGSETNKQNSFDDFIAAAEYLIDSNYTSKAKLAISGQENGGLLVGACMMQRPDLFQVALPNAGILDMLRYHKFPNGSAFEAEYGNSEGLETFNNLYAYSPLHNINTERFPATLVTTTGEYNEVSPAHSYKFAASLQANNTGELPTFIKVYTDKKHPTSPSISKKLEAATDKLSFMMYYLQMKPLNE